MLLKSIGWKLKSVKEYKKEGMRSTSCAITKERGLSVVRWYDDVVVQLVSNFISISVLIQSEDGVVLQKNLLR